MPTQTVHTISFRKISAFCSSKFVAVNFFNATALRTLKATYENV